MTEASLSASQQGLARAYAGGAPGVLIERTAFKAPKASIGKPLETLAIEATIPLFTGVLIAWVLLVRVPDLAIPTFAAIVGARYFLFRTMYGEIAYRALGGAILLIAGIAMFGIDLPLNLGLFVGVIELVATALILQRWRART